MKRITILLISMLLAAGLYGQSLKDNSYLKKSMELQTQAQQAYEAGDYDAAADYAAQAQEFATLSDNFVEDALAKNKADLAIAAARKRMDWAVEGKIPELFPSEWSLANGRMDMAKSNYDEKKWLDAADFANQVLDALANVTPQLPLPMYYTVRLIPNRRDCLWRIAEYPFIYNDPYKWTLLYEANKKILVEPNNPDLIEPEQILIIPSIGDEKRSGTYDPTKKYEALPKK